jgi:hypothetical protein
MNVFLRLKDISNNYKCSLEKKLTKMNISFTRGNNENFGIFIVRKKNVAQNRLNIKIIEQILDNKTKLKLIKKQLTKMEKNVLNKNMLIDDINKNIDKMTNEVNKININENIILNNLLEKKSNNNTNNNNCNKSDVKNSPQKEMENEDIIKKTYKINEQENLLLRQNLSEKEGKKNINSNKKNKQKNYIKKNKNTSKEKEACDPEDDSLFCFENIEVYKNKKIFEILILFNVFTVLIIMYLLCLFCNLKSILINEKLKDQDYMKKIAFLNLLDNSNDEDDIDGIRDNIVDFQLINDDSNEKNTSKKMKFSISRKKPKDSKCLYLLREEREKRYYKKHIRKKFHFRIRDINFDLKYNSKDAFKFKSIYNNYQDISQVLVVFITKDKKKYGLFSNNIFLYERDPANNNIEYTGFVYNNGQISELALQEFYNNYGNYLQKIFEYLRSEYLRIKNNINNTSSALLGNIEIFEIYQVKYTR